MAMQVIEATEKKKEAGKKAAKAYLERKVALKRLLAQLLKTSSQG